jgi:hypothetical protein
VTLRIVAALAESRTRIAFVAMLAVLFLAVPVIAEAAFSAAATQSQSISTDTMVAPTGIGIKCKGTAQRATITWTPTVDTYATGYVIYVSSGGSETSENVAGRATASDDPLIAVPSGSTVTLVSVYRSWTSVRSVSVTAPTSCH